MKQVLIATALLSGTAGAQSGNSTLDRNAFERRVEYERQAERNRAPVRRDRVIIGDYETPAPAARPATVPRTPSASEQAYDAAVARNMAIYWAEKKQNAGLERPYFVAAVQAGYDMREAARFAATLREAEAAQPGEGARRTAALERVMREYQATRDTAPFETLHRQATEMVDGSAPITAFRMLKVLQARFPERSAELDPLRARLFSYYFVLVPQFTAPWDTDPTAAVHREIFAAWSQYEGAHVGAYRALFGDLTTQDPDLFPYDHRSPYRIERDGLRDVRLVNVGLSGREQYDRTKWLTQRKKDMAAREIATMRRDGFPQAYIDAMTIYYRSPFTYSEDLRKFKLKRKGRT